ncbi:neurogenic locus notch homolog protein 2-like [Mercenaria mercenaria]|uniref:neurogenic locus notch homolog protein 2-like n=1 Tax=Mercenaria mercenaria TaxID=6596 RepID=UPI00234F0575|nr:neurogenic locus notch homolog protein 2-like [Mercenaria mercenaria]
MQALAVITVLLFVQNAEGLTCLKCDGVPTPRICNKVVECYDGELCSVEKVLNEFGEHVYNLGCLSNKVCSNFTSILQSPTITCSECCRSANLCNSKGCGEQGYPAERGPICYNCPLHTATGRCHDIEFCSPGEVCNIVGKNVFSDVVYTSRCISKHACKSTEENHVAIIGKRDVGMEKRSHGQHICDLCCEVDVCNKDCTTARLNIDPCRSSPCYHGNCTLDGGNFKCECYHGYNGALCEKDIDECSSNPCNNGTCIDDIGTYSCVCYEGFSGPRCKSMLSDCLDVLRHGGNQSLIDGIYKVRTWKTQQVIEVYCDMTTDGGGWTVFQYRFNGTVDFYRNLSDYENGFGDLNTEFWLGLRYIQEIASKESTYLRIDLEAPNGTMGYETFDNFSLSIGPAYTLHLGRTIASSRIFSPDDFGPYHRGNAFITYDHDRNNCAVYNHGGWWYNNCHHANLNGRYLTPGTSNDKAMVYESFLGTVSLKSSKMMMRRK